MRTVYCFLSPCLELSEEPVEVCVCDQEVYPARNSTYADELKSHSDGHEKLRQNLGGHPI